MFAKLKTGSRLLASALPLAMLLQSGGASSCSLSSPVAISPGDYRGECKRLKRNSERTLADLRTGKLSYSDVSTAAFSFEHGVGNCQRDEKFAYALLNASVASPIPVDTSPATLLALARSTYFLDEGSNDRLRDITMRDWLVNSTWQAGGCSPGSYRDALPEDWTEEETRNELLKPANWSRARRSAEKNPMRDRMVMRELMDRNSPNYLGGDVIRLALKSEDPSTQLAAAGWATDLQYMTTPDYAAAEKLLAWYSPHRDSGLTKEEDVAAWALWVRIAQTMLSNEDGAIRDRGEAILSQKDPQARPLTDPRSFVPEGAKLIVLEHWPEGLPTWRNSESMVKRLSDRMYSRLAMKRGEAGVVKPVVLFAADGSFSDIMIIQSRGETLDTRTRRIFDRYFRPKISKMRLEGYAGRYVTVPLPAIKWQLGHTSRVNESSAELAGDTIIIRGNPVISRGY